MQTLLLVSSIYITTVDIMFKETNMLDYFLVHAVEIDAWICMLTRFLCVAMTKKLFLNKVPHIQS